MDDAKYKRICAGLEVMSRPDLRATEVRLREAYPDLADLVVGLLGSQPVPKPLIHISGPESDFIWLDLIEDDIWAIHDALRDQEASVASNGEPYPPELDFVTRLADKWHAADSSRSDSV